MLSMYRRHVADCEHRKKGRVWKRCSCPIWVQGKLNGKRVRESLNTRNWETAARAVLKREAGEKPEPVVPMREAIAAFERDCKARRLSEATLKKYRFLLTGLKQFETVRVAVEDLRKFREGWTDSAISAAKKLERIRTFFRFCVASGWIEKNPAEHLKPPKVVFPPTLPFTAEEEERILKKCRGKYRLLILTLRYSGLRISDALKLGSDKLKENKLFLYQHKTGEPVWIPLPDSLAEELRRLPDPWFWKANGGKIETATSRVRRGFKNILRRAGVKGHLHMWRDTFAVRLLEKGVSLEVVSLLLGHASIRVTEKHYAPWVKSRQENLEKLVRAAWK